MVRKDVGSAGHNVAELLADYQFYEIGSDDLGLTRIGGYGKNTGLRFGSSFFRLLQFDLKAGQMSVDTYSAYLDNFGASEYDTKKRYNGTEDDLRLPIAFHGRTTSLTTDTLLGLTPSDRLIGTVRHESGQPASVEWADGGNALRLVRREQGPGVGRQRPGRSGAGAPRSGRRHHPVLGLRWHRRPAGRRAGAVRPWRRG